MGVALRNVSEDVLYALAAVLSLPPDELGTPRYRGEKVRPSARWLADQEARVPGLPRCLLTPAIPRGVSVKVAQVAKRVVMAASGGADVVAARAAASSSHTGGGGAGVNLDSILHPRATPTVLCHAHRKLHPELMREVFYYLSREVADHADTVRRHARHEVYDDERPCQARAVRDWGYRMMGISALWCGRHALRALDQGRQVPPPPGHGHNSHNSHSSHHSHHSHHSHRHERPHPNVTRVRSAVRLPHLELPCEACVLAAVGARSQTLVDLRAGMLSRLAEEAEERQRRRQQQGKAKCRSDAASSSDAAALRRTHLWLVLDAYINALGDDVAAEIRRRSEALAEALFSVRVCESRRRRHQARDKKRRHRSHHQHHHHHSRHRDGEPDDNNDGHRPLWMSAKRPPRMVTKHGHRLPLPLLPLALDPWASGYDGDGLPIASSDGGDLAAEACMEGEDVGGGALGGSGGDGDDEEPYYCVQEDEEEAAAVEADVEAAANHDDDDDDDDDEEAQQGTAAAADSAPVWEDDYRRHVLESETTFSSQGASGRESYVTLSAHTYMPPGSRHETSGPFYTPGRGLSPIPDVSVASRHVPISPPSSSCSTRTTRTSRTAETAETARTTQRARPTRPVHPPPSASALPLPRPQRPVVPPPASSVYSQQTTRTRGRPGRPPPSVGSASASVYSARHMRPTAASSAAAAATSTTATSTRTAHTARTARTARTGGTPASYVALQAGVAAAFGMAGDNASRASGTTTRTTPASRATSRATATTTASRASRTTATTAAATSRTQARSTATARPSVPASVASGSAASARRSVDSVRTAPSDVYGDSGGDDDCTVVPDDSISVVASRRFQEEMEREQRQERQRQERQRQERQRQRRREQQQQQAEQRGSWVRTAPRPSPSRTSGHYTTTAAATNSCADRLNRYQPADSRRPQPPRYVAVPAPHSTHDRPVSGASGTTYWPPVRGLS